jgi:hypothetical protein
MGSPSQHSLSARRQAMRITFLLSGGFAGRIQGCRIDTADLPHADRSRLEALVAASGLSGRQELFTDAGRDLRRYGLVIEAESLSVRLECDERTAPPDARPLLAALAARATPQPLSFELPAPPETRQPRDA